MRTWPFNGETEREREEIGLRDALRNTHAGVNIQGEALRGLPNPPDLMKRSLRKNQKKYSYFSLCKWTSRLANPDVNGDTVLAGEETEGRRGRCEAGPARGELRTKVFHSSGA